MAQTIKRYSAVHPSKDEIKMLFARDRRLKHVLAWVDSTVLQFLKEFRGTYLVGGALRNVLSPWEVTDVKDYDISFLHNAARKEAAVGWWMANAGTSVITYPKCTEITRSVYPRYSPVAAPIQLLDDRYHTVNELLDHFDFTICQFGLGWNCLTCEWELTAGPTEGLGCECPWSDLADQILRYVKPQRNGWSGTSLARSYKFSRMGYRISDSSMAELCRTVFKETSENFEEWDEQKGHFPEVWEHAATSLRASDYNQFLPRFQRGLAHYNKGGSLL